MPEAEMYTFVVERDAGERIDRFVAAQLAALSRTAVQRLIDEEAVTVNEAPVKASHRLSLGDKVVVSVPPPRPVTLEPQSLPLDIVYEDADILVVNKAAGMVVHPGAGHRDGTLVNAILAHCPDLAGIGGELRPGIVHRLDKDTSGLLVVAKHDQAIRRLQRQFKGRLVQKRYTALVAGRLDQDDGFIEAPIGRHQQRRKQMTVRSGGKMARTRWRVEARYRDDQGQVYTRLDVTLLTGRTHQIRVHFSWMGYPLVGDDVYAPSNVRAMAPRQFLHARELGFKHPVSGAWMDFTAPLPEDLQAVLARLTPESE